MSYLAHNAIRVESRVARKLLIVIKHGNFANVIKVETREYGFFSE